MHTHTHTHEWVFRFILNIYFNTTRLMARVCECVCVCVKLLVAGEYFSKPLNVCFDNVKHWDFMQNLNAHIFVDNNTCLSLSLSRIRSFFHILVVSSLFCCIWFVIDCCCARHWHMDRVLLMIDGWMLFLVAVCFGVATLTGQLTAFRLCVN